MFSGSSNIKAINIYHAYFSDFTLKINIMEKIFQINTNIIVCGNNSFFTYINEGPLCEINISCMNKIFYMDSSYTDLFCKTRCLNESYNNTCPEFPLENKEINNDLYNNSTSNENNNNNIFTTDIAYNEINDNRSSIFSDDIFFDHSDTIMDTTIYYDKTMSETIQNGDSNIVTFINDTNNNPTFNNSTFINVEFITNTINSETINIISNISNSIYSELYNTTNMIIPLECYSSCKACEIEGNESNHNCLECKDNYKFELYITNYKNCYNNCSNYYMYEYNNICYNKCPENTISSKYYQCEEIINIINSTENNKSKFVENIKNELLNKINIIDIDKGNDISLTNDDLLITFSSTLNKKNNVHKNKTSINLGGCETKLKNNYNISLNNSLYIFKIDKTIPGMKIPKIEYEIYYPLFNNNTLILLNLSICSNMKIDISIPIEIEETLDKYNTSSNYYSDLCSRVTSKSGTDITLNDRKNEFIDNNMTLCE